MHSHLLNYFYLSGAQFGKNVCFSCIPEVPTKNWAQRITVVSLQSFNGFHRTFLDYTGNCYKYFLTPLSSTQLKNLFSFWSWVIAEVLPIRPCNASWMACPVTLCYDLSMTAVPTVWLRLLHLLTRRSRMLSPCTYCMSATPGCRLPDWLLCQFY